jgi:hypothetical protein
MASWPSRDTYSSYEGDLTRIHADAHLIPCDGGRT